MGKEVLQKQLSEEDIRQEIKEAEKNDLTLFTYLNNFYSNFPGQFYRKFFMSIPDQDGVPFIKIPFSQIVGEINLNSPKLYASTYENFFSEIDEVIDELGVDLDYLDELSKERETNKLAIKDMLLPPYIKLRLRGYNHHDLTG